MLNRRRRSRFCRSFPSGSATSAKIDMRKNLIARGKRVYLVVPEGDTKNNEPIDFELPGGDGRDRRLGTSGNTARISLRAPTDALFPGEGSGPKSARDSDAQIKAAVFRFTGLTVNPHLFRHAGAKIFLDQRPGQYEVVRQVLRHRSIETTTSLLRRRRDPLGRTTLRGRDQ